MSHDYSSSSSAKRTLPLEPQHWDMLVVRSGIDPKTVQERQYRSITDSLELAMLGLKAAPTPGIVIPIFPPGANGAAPAIVVYRPDSPADPKRKYHWPAGVRMRLDSPPRCHPQLEDVSTMLYIVEGVKKADALASWGACVIALGGVGCFGGNPDEGLPILGDWEHVKLNGRKVRIAFDSDAWRNPNVMRQLLKLTAFLRARGAIVLWVRLPDAQDGSKLGIDDWLLTHGLEEVEALIVEPAEDPLIGAELNHSGDGDRFAYLNAGRAQWLFQQKRWACWNGTRWDTSNQERVFGLAKATVRETQIAAAKLPSADVRRDPLLDYTRKMGNRYPLDSMIAMARDQLSTANDQLDANPWLLNCRNGTIDLRTGDLQPHDPNDLITQMAPVAYDPDSWLDEWNQLIAETTAGKVGLAEFLQVALGYSATGDTSEDKLFMPLGKTRTGKSTIIEAVKATLGDYAATANFATFIRKRDESTAREDIARLAGKRFVSSVEVEEGKVLADAIIKQLTGGDTVAARFLYQETFEYTPQLKLWLVANDEPKISKDNEAMWERVIRLPFDNYIPPEKRDRELKARLKDPVYAGPAILAWIVKGALRWQAEGLVVPDCVKTSTSEYRERMDPLEAFIEDECFEYEGARYPVRDCFPMYTAWAKRNNVRDPLGRNTFNAALRARGLEQKRDSSDGRPYWAGIGPVPLAGERIRVLGENALPYEVR